MAIQYPGFPIPKAPEFSGMRDLAKNIAQGYQVATQPGKDIMAKRAQDLQNAYTKMQMQYYPQLTQAQIAKSQAEANLATGKFDVGQSLMGRSPSNDNKQPQVSPELISYLQNQQNNKRLAGPVQPQYMQDQTYQNVTQDMQNQAMQPGQRVQQSLNTYQYNQQPTAEGYQQQQSGQLPFNINNPMNRLKLAYLGINPQELETPYSAKLQELQAEKEIQPQIASEVTRAEGMQKANVDRYAQSVSDYDTTNQILQNLSGVMPLLNDPNLKNNVGRFNNLIQSTLGVKPGADINGTMSSLFGAVQVKLTNEVQGNAAKSKIQLMDRIKPTPRDPLPVLIGKLEALNNITKWANDYSYKVGTLLESNKNMTALEAEKIARESVPFDKYEGEIKRLEKLSSLARNGEKIYRKNGQYYIGVQQTGEAVLLDEYDDYLKENNIKNG